MAGTPIQIRRDVTLSARDPRGPAVVPMRHDRVRTLLWPAKTQPMVMTQLRLLLPQPTSRLSDDQVVEAVAVMVDQGTLVLSDNARTDPKCATPIMQPQYTAIFGQMGKELKINPLFLMSTALQESGWNLPHVYGTNSSSNGQPLNNLFGMTKGGFNNIAYPSVQASAVAWIANWGSYLAGQPQTIEAYAAALTSNPLHMYNKDPGYPGKLAARYKQLVSATAACKTTF